MSLSDSRKLLTIQCCYEVGQGMEEVDGREAKVYVDGDWKENQVMSRWKWKEKEGEEEKD